MDILELNKRLKKLGIEKLKSQSVKECAENILNVNRNQMLDGYSNNEQFPFLSTYSNDYLKYKLTLTTYYSNPYANLFVTGEFQKKMYLRVNKNNYEINSRSFKTEELLERYGDTFFGLNNNSKEIVMPIVTKKFGEIFKKTVGL